MKKKWKRLEGGKKHVLIIGIQKNDILNADNMPEGRENEVYYTFNHEEFHGEKTLDGRNGKDKVLKDHGDYYGEERFDSPNNSDVKTNPKYKNTKAKRSMDEIDRILKNLAKPISKQNAK